MDLTLQIDPTTGRRLSAEDGSGDYGSGNASLFPATVPVPISDYDDDCVDNPLTVVDGWEYCEITSDGVCGHPARYRRRLRAVHVPSRDDNVIINAVEFDTERDFDYLTIGRETYTGRRGPRDMELTLGTTFTWRSDRSTQR